MATFRVGGNTEGLPEVQNVRNSRIVVVVLSVVLALLVGAPAFAEYDRPAIRAVMQDNLANLPQLNAAANAGNFMEAAGYLLSMAQGMYTVKDFTPPKGEEAHFKATVDDFLFAAFRGLAACADGDQAALKAAIARMTQDRNEGHAQHKP